MIRKSYGKKIAYLAGAIEKAPDSGVEWRKNATPVLKKLGLNVFDPCVETDGKLAQKLGWKKFTTEAWRDLKENNYQLFCDVGKWIVNEDLDAIVASDILIVFFDKYVTQGAGTYGEITLAKWLNKKIYLFLASDFPREEVPLWVTGCVTRIFNNFEDLVTYLRINVE